MRTVSAAQPSGWLECLYYAQVFYSVMGPAVGLSFGSLGFLMLGTVAAGCAISVGRLSLPIFRSVGIPVACGVSFVAIQVLVHDADLDNGYVRDWVPWLVAVVALQHLTLRPGFLHRAAIVVFLVGIATLPYLKTVGPEHRTGLATTITIANPNDFGAWFGFCCVYFAVLGLEARRNAVRAVAWSLAVVSLVILGLSVSRGPLFAVAVAVVFALRRVLKKGFLPLLFLCLAGWMAFALGLFDRSAALYAQRGLEETGRLQVWPLAVSRFLDAPFSGVGADRVDTYLPGADALVTPHNAPIFIALASGMVPLVLFVIYCGQLALSAYKAPPGVDAEAPFHRALLLYAFLIAMNLNVAFMVTWAMVTFASVANAGLVAKAWVFSMRAMRRSAPTQSPAPAMMAQRTL